jgi:hypothetical protein
VSRGHRGPAALLVLLAVALGAVAVAATGRPPARPPPRTAPVATPPPSPVPAGGGYFPLDPVPVVEAATLAPGGGLTVALTGVGGVPPGGVEAVAVSLSAAPAAGGRLAVAAGDLPATPDDPGVALSAGVPASAFLVVAVPPDGRVRLANLAPGATTVGVGVGGYYAAPCGGGGAGFVPADPDRPVPLPATLGPGQSAAFQVAGPGGPATGQPVAVALQVRATGAATGPVPGRPEGPAAARPGAAPDHAAAGGLLVGPDEPGAAAGPATGFRVIRLGASGRVRVVNPGGGQVAVTVGVRGWYRPGAGASYRTAGPERLLDATIPAGRSAAFAAGGVGGVPAGGVGAVALEVRAAGAAAGHVELAGGTVVPVVAGRESGGFDLAAPGPDGRLMVRNATARPARVTVRARGYHGAPAPLRAAADPATQAVFDPGGAAEPGWTGGDGNVPVRLPDGRIAWLFGDSFHGTVRPDGSRPPSARLVRNAMVVQDGRRLETRVGPADPASGHPTALLTPPPEGPQGLQGGAPVGPEGSWEPHDGPAGRRSGSAPLEGSGEPRGGAPAGGGSGGTWLWPGAGMVEGGQLQVFLQEFRRPAGATDPAAFEWTGRNLLASLSLPDLAPREVVPLGSGGPGPGRVGWGTAVLQEADFTYLYGAEDTGPPLHVKYAHLARFPRGGARRPWSFWDGAGWSPDPARSARLVGAAANAPRAASAGALEQLTGIPSSVVLAGASYLELFIPDSGHEVMARLACSPAGPWGPPLVLYRTGERDQAYLPRAYPDGSGLVLAYSRAPLDPAELFARAAAYLPGFVRIR